MVSVCLASYNGAKHIGRQVRSILSQLGPQDELIISDDASTDDTLSVVSSFDDSRIRVLNHKPSGLTANFENAIREAHGDIVFLSDQDDCWLPGKVHRVMEAFSTTGAMVIHHDARVVNASGVEIIPSYCKWRGVRKGVLRNIVKTSYLGCCMAFRRDIMSDLLPIINCRSGVFAHDDWVGLVGELRGGVLFLDDVLMEYYRHGENFSSLKPHSLTWKIGRRLIMIFAVLGYYLRRLMRRR